MDTHGYKNRQKIRPTFTCIFAMTSEPGKGVSRIMIQRGPSIVHYRWQRGQDLHRDYTPKGWWIDTLNPLGKPFWHPNWKRFPALPEISRLACDDLPPCLFRNFHLTTCDLAKQLRYKKRILSCHDLHAMTIFQYSWSVRLTWTNSWKPILLQAYTKWEFTGLHRDLYLNCISFSMKIKDETWEIIPPILNQLCCVWRFPFP